MKTMSKISSRSATPVAAQVALARVTRGARVTDGPGSDGVVSAGSSSAGEEEGSVVMIPTFLSFVIGSQRGPLTGLPDRDLATARAQHRQLPDCGMRVSALGLLAFNK
jgi:hypothetical protein